MDKTQLIQGIEITVIGVSVVFAGLILTYLMINLFSVVPRMIGYFRNREKKDTGSDTVASPENIPPDHLAVVVAVIDIEMKMRSLLDKGRFTFK